MSKNKPLKYSIDDAIAATSIAIACGSDAVVNPPKDITLRDYYKSSGLTRAAFAEALNIAPITLDRYLQGTLAIPEKRMERARLVALSTKAVIMAALTIYHAREVNQIHAYRDDRTEDQKNADENFLQNHMRRMQKNV